MEDHGWTAVGGVAMKKKKNILFIYSLIALLSLVLMPNIVHGIDSVGGQVTTGGKISFFEEEKKGDNVSSPFDKIEMPPAEKNVGVFAKLIKRLPNTGELVNSFWLIGLGLIFLVIWFIWKKTKEEK